MALYSGGLSMISCQLKSTLAFVYFSFFCPSCKPAAAPSNKPAATNSQQSQNSNAPLMLGGIWIGGCSKDDDGAIESQNRIFDEKTKIFKMQQLTYSVEGCKGTPDLITDYRFAYSTGKLEEPGVWDIDFIFDSLYFTFSVDSESGISELNSKYGCNMPINFNTEFLVYSKATGPKCTKFPVPTAGLDLYTVVSVKGDTLFFGDTKNAPDGLTAEKRQKRLKTTGGFRR